MAPQKQRKKKSGSGAGLTSTAAEVPAAEVPAKDGVSPGVEGDRVGWRGTQDG